MDINLTKIERDEIKDHYKINVVMMEGDADNYHLDYWEVDEEQLYKYVIVLETLKGLESSCSYFNADNYCCVPGFEETFSDDWHYSIFCDCRSSFERYDILFITSESEYNVEIALSDEDKKLIKQNMKIARG